MKGRNPNCGMFGSEMTTEELALVTAELKARHFTRLHLEIGTGYGGTLRELLLCYPSNACPPFVVVDPMNYFPEQLENVRKNLRQHELADAPVTFEVKTSDAAFANWAGREETFDFILIDGIHKLRYTVRDLRWSRMLAVGGLLCLHDYKPKFPGVMMAVQRFLKRNPHFQKVELAGGLMVLTKTAPAAEQEITLVDRFWSEFHSLRLQVQSRLHKRWHQWTRKQ
ncbi:MAG: class I SAM-dependent methyltransferase [SAR324 cluster bacterium]|nr:class I SAM-dependent methyltransferase [SAR324 cluster bacterium]